MRNCLLALTALIVFSTPAFAASGAKSYQVTGPVTDLNDSMITVQKGTEKWQINRGTANIPADIKVGSKVTIMYTMTATSVVSKDSPVGSATPAPAKK